VEAAAWEPWAWCRAPQARTDRTTANKNGENGPCNTVRSRYKRQLIQLNINKSGLYGLE